MNARVSIARIAELSGLHVSTVWALLYKRPAIRRIRPDTEAKILSVRACLDSLAPAAHTDSTGTRRRLQALTAVGWTMTALASRMPREDSQLRTVEPDHPTPAVAYGSMWGSFRNTHVTATHARAVRILYDQLWNVMPDESTPQARRAARMARNRADKAGWPPPLAWDDDVIDDPDASPTADWKRPRRRTHSSVDLADDAAELLHEYQNRALVADRLGVTRSALEKAISRAGQASSPAATAIAPQARRQPPVAASQAIPSRT